MVFSLVAQEGDRAVYDRIWELERAAELHEEKIRLLMSHGAVPAGRTCCAKPWTGR